MYFELPIAEIPYSISLVKTLFPASENFKLYSIYSILFLRSWLFPLLIPANGILLTILEYFLDLSTISSLSCFDFYLPFFS